MSSLSKLRGRSYAGLSGTSYEVWSTTVVRRLCSVIEDPIAWRLMKWIEVRDGEFRTIKALRMEFCAEHKQTPFAFRWAYKKLHQANLVYREKRGHPIRVRKDGMAYKLLLLTRSEYRSIRKVAAKKAMDAD